jgi:hypothetical protein
MKGKNLSLFSTYLGANMAPSLDPYDAAHVLHAVDDFQVAAAHQEAGIVVSGTSRRQSTPRPWLSGFVVFLEQADDLTMIRRCRRL